MTMTIPASARSLLLCLGMTCAAPMALADDFPLNIDNCGVPLQFNAPIERVVTLGQNSTEILLMLGLADRIAGSAVWVSPVLPELAEEESRVERISNTMPSFEAVISREPELLAAQFAGSVGPEGRVGTRDQFADLDIPAYISPTNCGMEVGNSGDGLRETAYSNAALYAEVDELSRIFGIPDRGAELLADLQAREAAVRERVAGRAEEVSILYWFSSPEIAGDAWVAGRNGAPAYINGILGAQNVIESDEDWPLVGWETIAAADPTVIVVGTMDRRNQAADDPALKREFLMNDPVARELTAVREGRIVEMDAQAMNPTLRTIQGLEVVAAALNTFGLLE